MKKTMILMAACLVAGTAAAQDSPVDDWGANWFLSAKGGVSAFIGKPVGHGDLFDREKPLLNVSVGKWFTPHVAGRLAFQGLQLKDANIVSCNYQNLHVDFLYNLTAHSDGMQKWDIIPYATIISFKRKFLLFFYGYLCKSICCTQVNPQKRADYVDCTSLIIVTSWRSSSCMKSCSE